MPTYILNESKPKSIQGITFLPGQEIKLNRYLNLNDYPEVSKVSNSPEPLISQHLIFENITTITNMSPILTLDNRKCIEIFDGDSPGADGDIVDIRVFMGDTDDQSRFVPYRDIFRFIRVTQKSVDEESYAYWYPLKEAVNRNYEENLIPSSEWPVVYPFFSIAVINASLGGMVNIYLRDVRQVLRNML